jgi:hypothetical protein
MSESTASFDYEDVSMPEDSHVKKDILRRQSVMDEADVHALVVTFGIRTKRCQKYVSVHREKLQW